MPLEPPVLNPTIAPSGERTSALALFLIFLRLGLTAFGGPAAHLGYFRQEFVDRRRWFTERSYADLVALCQFLPGPASSQVGMAIGRLRGGYLGMLSAWLGFTLPTAVFLVLLALGLPWLEGGLGSGVLQGLKIAAVAVVAHAVWAMARVHCPDPVRVSFLAIAAAFMLLVPTVWAQLVVIGMAAAVGVFLLRSPVVAPVPGAADQSQSAAVEGGRYRWTSLGWLVMLALLLLGLPLLALQYPSLALTQFEAYLRTGALVFGGGHVVLPMLEADVVQSGWVPAETFLAGYGAVQAMPGPLFAFAAFLGASHETGPGGWAGASLAIVAIFLPSFLLVLGTLPLWEYLRHQTNMQAALAGVNAAVVGLLVAAFYQPVWTSTVQNSAHAALALLAYVALVFWRCPPWLLVLGCGLIGGLNEGLRMVSV